VEIMTGPALWLTIAHKLLASVLTDHGAVFPIRDVVHGTDSWWPGQTAAVWRAILRCVEADTPPTPEAVIARLADGAQPGYVKSIAAEFNAEDNRRVTYYAQELRRWGMLADYRALGRLMADADDVDKVDDYIGYADVMLRGLGAQTCEREGDALTVSEQAWSELEAGNVNLIPTSLDWFDNSTGGLWSSMDTWIVAAYKMGKSTLMRNWVLAAAEAGHPVDVFNAEGGRGMFAFDCQAMLATRWLIQNGIRDLRLSGLFLRRVWAKKEQAILTRPELDAIRAARTEWTRLPIWTWDARDGITDLGALTSQIRRSKLEHGMQACYLDYSQLFGKGVTIFERQSTTALALQRIAQVENIAVVVLAQRNEAGIKSGDSHSPDVKGGGDAPAAADFLFTTKIDEDCQNMLTIKLKLSRHTVPSPNHDHAIEPESGLLIDKWMQVKREPLPDYSADAHSLLDELPGGRR
jgi:hypothetical protein